MVSFLLDFAEFERSYRMQATTDWLTNLKVFLAEADANGQSDSIVVAECEILSYADVRSAVAEVERLRKTIDLISTQGGDPHV